MVTGVTRLEVPGQWLTLAELAAALDWHLQRVQSRARREGWPRRRANRGQAMEYLVPAALLAAATELTKRPDGADRADGAGTAAGMAERRRNGAGTAKLTEPTELPDELAAPRAELAASQAELSAALAQVAELRHGLGRAEGLREAQAAHIAALTVALAKAEARADRLEAALVEARRPWLARVLEGLRRKG